MKRKLIFALLALLLCFNLAICVSAAPSTGHLYDDASLIDYSDEAYLIEKLADISGRYDAQLVVAIVDTTQGYGIDDFVDYAYDSMEFGYGENRDGVFLLVSMETREYRILSNGFAGVAIDSGDIDRIGDIIVPYLSDGAYLAGFESFADECAYYLEGYLYGYPFNAGENFLICLVIGVIAGVTVAFVLKGQLKTVRRQARANAYVKSGSMQLTVCRDIFLYRNVRRSEKASSSSSGSSGSSRSVGGGRF